MTRSLRHLIVPVAGVALAATACSSPQTGTASRANPHAANDAQRFAYGIGFNLGRDTRTGLADDGIEVDGDLVVKGFTDGLKGMAPNMPKHEFERVLRAVHRELLERSAQAQYAEDPEFRALADANAASSDAALSAFAAEPGTNTFATGVLTRSLVDGTGPKPGPDEVYLADWTLQVADGSIVDQRTNAVADPQALLPLAASVLSAMRVGDHWKVAFAPGQAFGLGGDAPAIGPNMAIFLDIKVVGSAKREVLP